MTPQPLDILKKGLNRLEKTVQPRKIKLEALLAEGKTISPADEHWLDHEASTVNERRVIDILEASSDYEMTLVGLDDEKKAVVKKLREYAGDLAKTVGNKRKRTLCL
jgi:hypothetical protein